MAAPIAGRQTPALAEPLAQASPGQDKRTRSHGRRVFRLGLLARQKYSVISRADGLRKCGIEREAIWR